MFCPARRAHQVAGGRWLLTGGGGYEPLRVVPRTWTHPLAEAAGHPIDPRARIPAAWREYASRRTGRQAPELMTEGSDHPKYAPFESGYDPADLCVPRIPSTALTSRVVSAAVRP